VDPACVGHSGTSPPVRECIVPPPDRLLHPPATSTGQFMCSLNGTFHKLTTWSRWPREWMAARWLTYRKRWK
jgi:hypothetical protein